MASGGILQWRAEGGSGRAGDLCYLHCHRWSLSSLESVEHGGIWFWSQHHLVRCVVLKCVYGSRAGCFCRWDPIHAQGRSNRYQTHPCNIPHPRLSPAAFLSHAGLGHLLLATNQPLWGEASDSQLISEVGCAHPPRGPVGLLSGGPQGTGLHWDSDGSQHHSGERAVGASGVWRDPPTLTPAWGFAPFQAQNSPSTGAGQGLHFPSAGGSWGTSQANPARYLQGALASKSPWFSCSNPSWQMPKLLESPELDKLNTWKRDAGWQPLKFLTKTSK